MISKKRSTRILNGLRDTEIYKMKIKRKLTLLYWRFFYPDRYKSYKTAEKAMKIVKSFIIGTALLNAANEISCKLSNKL